MKNRLNARILLAVVIFLVAVVFYAPLGHTDYANRWGDGTYGLHLPQFGGLDVLAVDPGSPAWKAGIRAGDRVLLPAFSTAFTEVATPRAGDRIRLPYRHRYGRPRVAQLTAVPVTGFGWSQRLTGILAILPATVFFIIAAWLVFLRPGIMTWAFLLFAIGYYSTGPPIEYWNGVLSPRGYLVLLFVLGTVFGNFAAMPLLPFVLRFPNDDVRGWRKKADIAIWAFIAVSYAAYVYQWFVRRQTGNTPSWSIVLDTWLPLAVFVLATMIVIKNYKNESPQVRQRASFLIAGVIVSFVAYAVYFIPGISYATAQVAGYFVIVAPVAVAYAVLRHRVLDVNFVLNRAIAYAVLSAFVLVIVSLLDWGSGQVVSHVHFATLLEVAVTVGIGFLLSRINTTFERWVDVLLFRRRHEAERYLRRVSAALPYATSEEAITDGLVHEPVEALELQAAALYRKSSDGRRFDGVGTSNETTVAPAGFDSNHNLVRFLQSGEDVVWLDDVRAHLDAANSAIYVLAIPICVRHELVSFVLYGAHRNGAQIDPDEVSALKELAVEAARAYDHVEAVRAHELIDRLMALPAGTRA